MRRQGAKKSIRCDKKPLLLGEVPELVEGGEVLLNKLPLSHPFASSRLTAPLRGEPY